MKPVEYLTDVLHRIDKVERQELRELLPDRWKPPPRRAPPVDFVA